MYGLSNVSCDSNSYITENKLCEGKYLAGTMTCLRDILPNFDNYEFSILSNPNKDISIAVKRNDEKRHILIWISEEYGDFPEKLSRTYDFIFKSYVEIEGREKSNVDTFPLGTIAEVPEYPYKDILSRKYNVFFSGNLNSSRVNFYISLLCKKIGKITLLENLDPRYLINRYTKKFILKIRNCFDSSFPEPSIIRFANGWKSGIDPEEYGRILSDSKIVLCPKGYVSTECFRHYEAMRAGCVVISERLPDTYLYKNSPIIQIDKWNDIHRLVRELLSDDSELERLSLASRKWYEDVLSEKATAHHIKEVLESRF